MRSLTVVQLLPALASGGVEHSTLEIAQALVAAGHRSVVVSAGGRLVAPLQSAGSEHIELDIGRKSPASLRHVVSLRRLFKRLDADIVHARSRLPAWLGWHALGARAPGARPHFVTTVHGLNSPGRYSGIMARGERVICVSESVRAHVLRHWPATPRERLRIIERGIDPEQFPRQRPRDGGDGRKRLLMPGRGTRLKGHAAAIDLLAGVRAAGIDASLWLPGAREAGREAYLQELQARASALGVAAQLRIDPPVDDMAMAYREADLVLQLSAKPESFGRTVVEALSSGRPVVGWDHGGVGELLARYFPAGRVPKGDAQALLATTLRALAEPLPPPVIHPQTLQGMQAQTLEVYDSLVG
jgi:glycosyltransferase involved in cell wall biosynthesis